ncbi:MAG: hypothetical protein EXX96DRAFT_68139 [Benjaminiella poitrasii]|nr:MAG: hypothetical protein EXX96DRAFT_68139 [Benjaminiella poitrasii]
MDRNTTTNEEDESTDGTEDSDDFFDAVESSSVPRSVPSHQEHGMEHVQSQPQVSDLRQNITSSADENGFVIIDHPNKAVIKLENKSNEIEIESDDVPKEQKKGITNIIEENPIVAAQTNQFEISPIIEENAMIEKKAEDLEKINQTALIEKDKEMASFDAIYGIINQDENKQQQEEDEPVMVSLSSSEISDPFTASTNSSTHRVAPPPPPQSRQVRDTTTPSATPVKTYFKKPPAPPPQPKNDSKPVEPQDFDSIFGTPMPTIVADSLSVSPIKDKTNSASDDNRFESDDNDEFEAYFSDPKFNGSFKENGETPKKENEFDSVFGVTQVPTAIEVNDGQTTVTSSPLDQMDLDNAFSVTLNDKNQTADAYEPSLQGFQDSFNQRIAEPVKESVSKITTKDENKGVKNINASRGVEENSNSPLKKEEPSQSINANKSDIEDGKKKKKKKNIVSWAKSFGGFDFSGLDSDKKKSSKKNKSKSENSAAAASTLPESTTTNASIHNSSGFDDSIHRYSPPSSLHQTQVPPITNNLAYDLDTIQGSHIAELVNMGFDPAAALDALDRYDQDLEKATNFLLDQAYK